MSLFKRHPFSLLAILFLLTVALSAGWGCLSQGFNWLTTSQPSTYLVASELVKTHPRMQTICDIADGCSNVTVQHFRFDNTGDDTLRGTEWWSITTPEFTASMPVTVGHPVTVDDAVNHWVVSARMGGVYDLPRAIPATQ